MQPARLRVKFTSEVASRLREEVRHRRTRVLQAVTAILQDLPREAAAFLDARPVGGYPSTCFLWPRVFLDDDTLWRLDCIVSRAGWPELLWVIDVFGRELPQ
jgi:hypothetical protein